MLEQSSAKNLERRAVVAMSGGVDSSVAALLLRREGYELVGISMQVWDYRKGGGSCSKGSCCAPDDFTDARMVASKLEVPYYVFDFEETFKKEVIDKFVAAYSQGLTPNPCIDCNNKVKFRELRDRAQAFGCGLLATGHYAKVEKRADGYHLMRPKDTDKDQTYFLYGLKQSELAQTLFPLAELTKPEVREIARENGLGTAEKAESQDICFVSSTVAEFISKIGRKSRGAGPLMRSDGTVVGQHSGIESLTVGQRKGLGLGGRESPLYILEIDPARNAAIVGEKKELERAGFLIKECSWVSPGLLKEIGESTLPHRFEALAQVRHRHAGARASVEINSFGSAKVEFLENWCVVAPGQAAVLYDLQNREVLGGGTIV